jgi:hypothetical protein
MGVTIRGEAATVRWAYHVAATLGTWTLTDGVLVAQIVKLDPLRVSQSPLTVEFGTVRRPLEGLQIAGATLTARLGPSETPHGLVSSLPDRHA